MERTTSLAKPNTGVQSKDAIAITGVKPDMADKIRKRVTTAKEGPLLGDRLGSRVLLEAPRVNRKGAKTR